MKRATRACTYRYDGAGPAPKAGDYLRSSRSTYEVVASRQINTRDGSRKFKIDMVRIGDEQHIVVGVVFPLAWDKRGPKP